MIIYEKHFIDKSQYPDGEWKNEPDEICFEYKGYNCYIMRNSIFGHLNGYVSIPKSHILYEVDYNDVSNVDVHGGLTFTAFYLAPENREWLLGFDCNHLGDFAPLNAKLYKPIEHILLKGLFENDPSLYKNVEFVKKEIESMVNQIIDYKGQ